MASCVSPASTHHRSGFPDANSSKSSNLQLFIVSFSISGPRSLSFPKNLHSPSLPLRTAFLRRRAAAPSSPPPPESDPPSRKNSVPLTGLAATFSRFQDSMRIFFAVLFWLSLFFWASAWDGRNSGRPNKGSRFRR